LSYTGIEKFEFPSGNHLLYLLLNGVIGTVVSDLLWGFVVILTTPTIATLGLSLTVPIALCVDLVIGKKPFHALYLVVRNLSFKGFIFHGF